MSHHFEIELTVRYQRDYTTEAEVSVSTESDAPHGNVAMAVAMTLGQAVARMVEKIQKDLGEAPAHLQIAEMLAKHAAQGDEKAAQLLAMVTPNAGQAETMAPGEAPSIDELNAMFNAAGYGKTDDDEHPQG